jgi:Flp pilus assembly protein TadG
LGPHTWKFVQRLRQRRGRDERGAEMVEFAIVVVLLIMLLYGILTYGLILAAQSTLTQAAADAARSALVVGTTNAVATAESQAGTDVGWMGKGTCGTSGTVITCNAVEETCPSNSLETCIKVTVTYNYSQSPLFPELPGLGVITPSTISSTNVLQLN